MITTYTLLKGRIERKTYKSYEDMVQMLNTFYFYSQITDEEYNELMNLLKDKEGK